MQAAEPININSSFFDGYYKDIWKTIFPEKTTLAETNFIIEEGKLEKGSKVLDLMCGYGRHSLELAKRGFNVTAIDNLKDYVQELKEKAHENNLMINVIKSDVLLLNLKEEYDAVIIMGNSLQFFNLDEQIKLLSNVANHVKKGGKLFINTWMLLEIVSKNFQLKSWSKINKLYFLTSSKWYFQPTRIETESIIIAESGLLEEKKGVDYIFSLSEIEKILQVSGFVLKVVYSIPGQKEFSMGDYRAYIVAERM